MSDIADVNSEAMATQALLVGLMIALRQSGTSKEVLERAFEFADTLAVSTAYSGRGGDALDGPQMTDIIDKLAKIVMS